MPVDLHRSLTKWNLAMYTKAHGIWPTRLQSFMMIGTLQTTKIRIVWLTTPNPISWANCVRAFNVIHCLLISLSASFCFLTVRIMFHAAQDANTEICEQTFSWLSNFKSMVRHMNKATFQLFILRMCWLHNEHKLAVLIDKGYTISKGPLAKK